MGRSVLIIYLLFFYYLKWAIFIFIFGYLIFLSNLTSQKDSLMVNKKNHQSNRTCSNQLVQCDQMIKLTKYQNDYFLSNFPIKPLFLVVLNVF
jgi:hypothetical protein